MSDQAMTRLIEEIESLPVEDRIRVADSVLKSLNPTDPELEEKWIKEAENRLSDVKSGRVSAVSEDDVFKKIRKRFAE